MTEVWFYDIWAPAFPPPGDWDIRRQWAQRFGDSVEFRAPRRLIRAPRPPYNWAEGSRAIEARAGATRMRAVGWQRHLLAEYNHLMVVNQLHDMMEKLGVKPTLVDTGEPLPQIVMLPHVPTRWERIKALPRRAWDAFWWDIDRVCVRASRSAPSASTRALARGSRARSARATS